MNFRHVNSLQKDIWIAYQIQKKSFLTVIDQKSEMHTYIIIHVYLFKNKSILISCVSSGLDKSGFYCLYKEGIFLTNLKYQLYLSNDVFGVVTYQF